MISILALTVLHFSTQGSPIDKARVTSFEAEGIPVKEAFEGVCKAAGVPPPVWQAGNVTGEVVAVFKDDPLPIVLDRCAIAADPPLIWREIGGKVYVDRDALITMRRPAKPVLIMDVIREVCRTAKLDIAEIVSVPQGEIAIEFNREPARSVLTKLHSIASPKKTYRISGSKIQIGLPPGSGQEQAPVEADVRVESHSGADVKWIEISKDGKFALVSGRGTTQLIDMATGLITRNLPDTELSFHPNGTQLYDRFNPRDPWYDMEKGQLFRPSVKFEGHFALSPDGTTAVHGFNTFEILNVKDGQTSFVSRVPNTPVNTSRDSHPDDIGSIFSFSQKGSYLAINHRKSSYLVNLSTGVPRSVVPGFATVFSDDEKTMASWIDKRGVLVEDLSGTKPTVEIPLKQKPTSLFLNKTGSELVVNSPDGLCVYDVATKKLTKKVRSSVTAFAIDEENKVAVAVGGGSFATYTYPGFQSKLTVSYRSYRVEQIGFAADGLGRFRAENFGVNLTAGGEIRGVDSELSSLERQYDQVFVSPSGEFCAFLKASGNKGGRTLVVQNLMRPDIPWTREFTITPSIVGFAGENELLLCGATNPKLNHTDYKVTLRDRHGTWNPILSRVPWEPRNHKVSPDAKNLISIQKEGGEKDSVIFIQKIAKNGAMHISWTLTPDLTAEDSDTGGVQFLGFDGASKGFYATIPVRVGDQVRSNLAYCEFGKLQPAGLLALDFLVRNPNLFATSPTVPSTDEKDPVGGNLFAVASQGEVWLGSRLAPRNSRKIKVHSGVVTCLTFSPDGSLLYIGTNEGDVCVWRVRDQRELARYKVVGDGQVLCQSRDNYYMGTPGVGRYAMFRFGASTFPFEQFDLRLNRPDLVLKALGLAKEDDIEAYHQAFKMRLRKMGLPEQPLGNDFLVPEVKVDKNAFPASTPERTLEFDLSCFDQNTFLQSVRVEVNGVPIHTNGELSYRGQGKRSVKERIKVELAPGQNRIRITAVNDYSAGSSPIQYNVACTASPRKPDLYLLAVGVSKYKDESHDLNFAQKDAEDLAKVFKRQEGTMYGKVNVRVLPSKDAVAETILQSKAFLQQAKVDDVVIAFFSGHGLRGGEMGDTYFYGVHDVDFADPAKNGLEYDKIASLLEGIPCRQKLMMLDTCHAGEIDDEVSSLTNQPKSAKGGKAEGRKANANGIAYPASLKTLQVMRLAFADFRRGTGAVVISASGGSEYAIEKNGNGIFTTAVIEALAGKAPGGVQTLKVSALAKYVANRVAELTDGSQIPEVRSDNLDNDFDIAKPKKTP